MRAGHHLRSPAMTGFFWPFGLPPTCCKSSIGECGGIFNLDGHAQIKKCPKVTGFFSCFSRLTGMAPAQANDTHLWMAQERGSRCCFRFFTRLGFALLNAKLAVPGHRESDGKLFDSSLWVPLKPLSMTPQCPPLHAESAQKNENSDNNSR